MYEGTLLRSITYYAHGREFVRMLHRYKKPMQAQTVWTNTLTYCLPSATDFFVGTKIAIYVCEVTKLLRVMNEELHEVRYIFV